MNEALKPVGADTDLLLTALSVRMRYGKSDMWIHRILRSDPDFPKPLKIRNQRFWRLSELVAFEESRRMSDDSAA